MISQHLAMIGMVVVNHVYVMNRMRGRGLC